MRYFLALWFLLPLAAGALPLAVKQALSQPGPVEILSLHPKPDPLRPGPTVGGFLILGHRQLGTEEGALTCAAVLQGLTEGEQEPESQSCCFDPRHSLSLEELDILLCYACHQWKAYQKGVEIGGGRITDLGSQECERAVVEHGLDWQGWAQLSNQLFHASGFSITLPPDFKAGHRAKHELLRMEPCLGILNLHFREEVDRRFSSADTVSLDSPISLAEFHEALRRQAPTLQAELDKAANQLEVFLSEDDFYTIVLPLLSPVDPEQILLYPSRDASLARQNLQETKDALERKAPLKESAPNVWTAVDEDHFYAVTLLERQGSYLVCRAEFRGDEATERRRWAKLLSLISFRTPTGHL